VFWRARVAVHVSTVTCPAVLSLSETVERVCVPCCVLVAVFGEEVCTAAFNRMNRCGENQTSSTRCCDAVGSAALTCANRKADVLTDASLSAAAHVYLSDCVAEGEPECEVDRLIPRVFA
jgi:hypothetical protein